jgi:predicted RNase H-like HicB family nuclease
VEGAARRFFQGKTIIEAQAKINEAIAGYLESLAKQGETENHPH